MISERQKQFDRLKLELSEFLGEDACGTFEFCVCCDKKVENPCVNAETKYKNSKNRIQSKKETTVNGKKAKFRATVVDKK